MTGPVSRRPRPSRQGACLGRAPSAREERGTVQRSALRHSWTACSSATRHPVPVDPAQDDGSVLPGGGPYTLRARPVVPEHHGRRRQSQSRLQEVDRACVAELPGRHAGCPGPPRACVTEHPPAKPPRRCGPARPGTDRGGLRGSATRLQDPPCGARRRDGPATCPCPSSRPPGPEWRPGSWPSWWPQRPSYARPRCR